MQETEEIDRVDREGMGVCGGGDGEDVVICDGISIGTERQEQVKGGRRRRGMRPRTGGRGREGSGCANGSTYPNVE